MRKHPKKENPSTGQKGKPQEEQNGMVPASRTDKQAAYGEWTEVSELLNVNDRIT